MVDEDGDLGGQRAGRSAAETVGAQWLPDLGHREHMQHGRRPDDGLFHGRVLGIGELVVAAGVSRRLRRLERPAANASGPFQAPAPSTTAAGTRSPPFRRLVNPAREEGAGRLPRPRSKKVELHSIDFFIFSDSMAANWQRSRGYDLISGRELPSAADGAGGRISRGAGADGCLPPAGAGLIP